MSRLGITIPFAGLPMAEHAELLREIEGLGYTDCWTMETAGTDAFTPLAFAAACTTGMRLGTKIVQQHHPSSGKTKPRRN